ncbi:hypothetical protein EDC94DRAFT_591016, partial [Helicostylum pulchrum]
HQHVVYNKEKKTLPPSIHCTDRPNKRKTERVRRLRVTIDIILLKEAAVFPDKTESPNCLLCLSTSISEETVDHFLFACPSKNLIWFNIITSYISSTGTPSSISALLPSILSLSLPNHFEKGSTITSLPELSTYQIFACTLLHIWRAHWRFAFDSTPFISANIMIVITKTLNQLNSEMQLDDK